MKYERASGILLHPTSLPGPFGIGDLGPQAHAWLEFLEKADCRLWQILPLGPTGYGDSPYQCFSAFAGNPYLVSPEALAQDGLLNSVDLDDLPDFPETHVDFGRVISWKLSLLDQAFFHFEAAATPAIQRDYTAFKEKHKNWLEDFALFMALKEAHGGVSWTMWEPPLRERHPEALALARRELEGAIRRQVFRQFVFFRQWEALHAHARRLGIQIIGDIPIFVAHDSADVWSHPELFYLNENGSPTVVAGVPPDYFSPTGQRWGNPLYRWRVHKADGYSWWLKRMH
jgi:4-alpha-glucanotransferase